MFESIDEHRAYFIFDEFDISTYMMVTGPLVEARLCLATEPEDDSGLAHTLEHLIFQVLLWEHLTLQIIFLEHFVSSSPSKCMQVASPI